MLIFNLQMYKWLWCHICHAISPLEKRSPLIDHDQEIYHDFEYMVVIDLVEIKVHKGKWTI